LLYLLAKAGELGNAEIREHMQLKDRKHVREHYIEPALAQTLIEYTLTGKPNSRLQKYRLTEQGRQWLRAHPLGGLE
jgi:DNA-binding PadR family transcriptional regulator